MKVLILFAHPAFHKSRVNQRMVAGLDQMEGVTFHDLYEEYPDFDIDVKREQDLLENHDVILFQFPLFWYSTPSLLKEWQDLVLEHGWAFGSQGNALKDKLFMCSITVGGPQAAYQIGHFHDHTLNQLLSPLRQTAKLCKMHFLPPFAVHGSHRINDEEIATHKEDLIQLLEEFKSDRFDQAKSLEFDYMNDFIETLKN